jgi:hypothetical protein
LPVVEGEGLEALLVLPVQVGQAAPEARPALAEPQAHQVHPGQAGRRRFAVQAVAVRLRVIRPVQVPLQESVWST